MNATRYLPFIGRLLIGVAFAMSGISKLAAYSATIALITSSKLPLPAPLAYAGAVMVEVGCGTLMIVGYQARVVASVLALFCVATAVFFHTNFADPDQIFHFIKNVVRRSISRPPISPSGSSYPNQGAKMRNLCWRKNRRR